MEGSPPFFAAAIVLAFYLGHLGRCRLRKERQAARAAAFRERVRATVPLEYGGLDLSLQQQSRPFRAGLWLQMNYPPGSISDQVEPREDWGVHVNV
jgi:hypothetical protein